MRGSRRLAATTRFPRQLGLVTVVALGWRLFYVWHWKGDDRDLSDEGDAFYYGAQAATNAAGDFFTHPFRGGPAADHPPVTALVLTPVSWVDDHRVLLQRLVMVLIGTAAVALIGLVGRRLGGDRVGLIAAALAAAHAPLWMNDGLLMAEAPAAVVVALVLLLSLQIVERSSPGRFAALGAVIGLAGLTRAELLLFLPLIVVPLVLGATDRWPDRLRMLTLAGGAAVAVLAPWVGWNMARFEEPTTLSTNDGLTLVGANCHSTYYTPAIGFWDLRCAFEHPQDGDPSEESAGWRSVGLEYMRENIGRLPKVVVARVGRVWGLYEPRQMVFFNDGEGREAWASWVGTYQHWAIMPLAAAGIVVLRRRRRELWPFLATGVAVTLTAALFYGIARFRLPADVALVVLAAVAVDRAIQRVRSGSSAPPT